MTLALRSYQVEAIEALRAGWALGQRRLLVSWPTGSGKTFLFSHVIKERLALGQRCLVIAHRGELLDQAMRTMLVVDPWAQVGRVQAARNAGHTQVVYASIQTIANAKRRERLGEFGLVVCDEVHHARAASWHETLAELGCWREGGPDLLGVTATPDRTDGKNLSHIFEAVAHTYSIGDAITAGYLAAPRGRLIATDLDMSAVRTTAGDYNAADLGAEMERVDIAGAIVRAWQDHASDRSRTVVFVPLVAIAENVAAAFVAAGVDAAAVHGKMAQRERARVLAGRHTVLINAMLLSEGWDDPEVSCVVWARPTQSRSLFQQCLDVETEVLTPAGWAGPDDIDAGDVVAAWDEDGSIQWLPALSKTDRPLASQERMYGIANQQSDIRVTGMHRMVYRTSADRPWKWGVARSMPNSFTVPAAGIESTPGVTLTDDELRFIGWVMTDGSINKGTGAITIAQSERHTGYTDAIERCLQGCGFKYRRYESPSVTNYGRRNYRAFTWVISRGAPRGTDKHLRGWGALSEWIDKDMAGPLTDMDQRQFAVWLEAVHMGDGHKTGGSGWTQRSFHVTSARKAFVDRLQALAVCRGWRTSVAQRGGRVWTVHLRPKDTAFIPSLGSPRDSGIVWEEVPAVPGERVWCVEVGTGAIVTRRRGKVAILGNCIGRGLRLHPSKRDCLVLDLVGSSGSHDLAGVSTLWPAGAVEMATEALSALLAPPGKLRRSTEVLRLAGAMGIGREALNMAAAELEVETCRIDGERWVRLPSGDRQPGPGGIGGERAGVMMLDREALGGSDVVGIDMMSRARFAWQRVGDAWQLPGGVRLVPSPGNLWGALTPTDVLGQDLDLSTAMAVAEDHVRRTGGAVLADREAPWRAAPVTEKQASLLRRFRRPVPETRGEAAAILDTIFASRKKS